MRDLTDFLRLVEVFCRARGISEARLSTLVLSGGSRIRRIRSGESDVGVKSIANAVLWMSRNWPDGAEWPADIERPAAEPVAADEAGHV